MRHIKCSRQIARYALVTLIGCVTFLPPSAGSREPLISAIRDLADQAEQRLMRGDVEGADKVADMVLLSKGVRIGLDLSQVDAKRHPECVEAAEQALQTWLSEVPDLDLEMAATPSEANLVVRFQRSVRYWDQEVAGFTTWTRSPSYVAGEVFIRTHYRRDLNAESMARILSHELGHILGLEDTDDRRKIMGPFSPGRSMPELTDQETRPVIELRSRAESVKRRAEQIRNWYLSD